MSNEWFHFLNIIGVAFFAMSGTLMAYHKKVDSFGMTVLATLTAVGGGTLRDVLLDQPVFWIADPDYLVSTYSAIFVTFILLRLNSKLNAYYILLVDAIGLGLFNIIGIEKSLIAETGMLVALTMGVCTAIFGGILRDIFCREMPLVMRGELYATACVAGGLAYAGLFYSGVPYLWCILGSLGTTIFLRVGAIHWDWNPTLYKRDVNDDPGE